ncbi:hypothetical protein K493DRAFT_232124 [Basidiobolus meristosporus CBS 931.73]|uniref:Uncharacterized protein n=1 Tax=Basidiobolus meristosporus CBS 931.73 TaxID=1314790 RepID=A0A1Y1XVW5_9FUNG|nr:hypothetical protein K493DRAFT_232124 [Basidiobolus meristosporus CBS 931.73]|eukprot:ORX89899.1 hypothetical protein K493DRAFT_232124 [Basidiobolus meristosporus CBS 931.73]
MLHFNTLVLFLVSTLCSIQVDAAAAPICTNRIDEYHLPPTEMTHELLKLPNSDMILISQMSNSKLVKVQLGPDGQVTGIEAHSLGGPNAGLHGLSLSTEYPGMIWCTVEYLNQLLLVDPQPQSLEAPPIIHRTIHVAAPGKGPHYIGEYGDFLWATLKESGHALRLNHKDYSANQTLFPTKPSPIFVAQHPTNKDFYVTQDQGSSLLRITSNGTTSQIPIPSQFGSTPVGAISGPHGVWFVLLGSNTTGTGTFGRINDNGQITWFTLKSNQAKGASLLHLAFESGPDPSHPTLWLLASSIVNTNAKDMIIKVQFDETYSTIVSEQASALPTQLSMAHRILAIGGNVWATELSTAILARLSSTPGCVHRNSPNIRTEKDLA